MRWSHYSLANAAYCSLFLVVLLVLLILAARTSTILINTDEALPQTLATADLLMGSALLLWALAVFVIKSGKLPSNLDPPHEALCVGPYLLFSHPMYLGFAVAVAGIMGVCNSTFGLLVLLPAFFWSTGVNTWS